MSHTETAARIGEMIGGPTNVNHVTTCATRLRFVVKDRAQVRVDELKNTKGVIQVVESGGQTQVVIGTEVRDVYDALMKLPEWADAGGDAKPAAAEEKVGFIDWLFALFAGTFQPLLMPLLGASTIKLILGLGQQLSLYDTANPPVPILVLTAASNAFFYFLPIFIGATASRKLGATPYLGAAISAALLEPSFTGLGRVGDVVSFLGMPMYVFDYTASVFPPILIAIALSYLEPLLKRVIHKNLQLMLVPTFAMLILVPVAALAFGPFGIIAGRALTDLITMLMDISPVLMGAVASGSMILMVMFGLHWALVPVILLNIQAGGDPIIPALSGYNFAVWGLALAVFLRTKDSELKELTGAGAASGLLAGISEPMVYGVILRFKRVIPIIVASAIVGGAIIGGFRVVAHAFAFSSLLTIPLMTPMWGYVLGISVSFVLAFAGTMVFGYESKAQGVLRSDVAPAPTASDPHGGRPDADAAAPRDVTLGSPLAGTVVPLSEVPDPVFAGGKVGAGVAIVPTEGRAYAPADGTVILAPPSGHAIGLKTDEGVQLLIHIGIDTVNLAGRGFTVLVETGQRVRRGEPLVDFDLSVISDAGYSPITPVVVTNKRSVGTVETEATDLVRVGDPLLRVTAKTRQSEPAR